MADRAVVTQSRRVVSCQNTVSAKRSLPLSGCLGGTSEARFFGVDVFWEASFEAYASVAGQKGFTTGGERSEAYASATDLMKMGFKIGVDVGEAFS